MNEKDEVLIYFRQAITEREQIKKTINNTEEVFK
jgi:hypothetical protein